MNIGQIGFLVRYGVSALVVAFLLGYSARYEWGLSRDVIRFSALGVALIIGTFVAIDLGKAK
jgi:predicted membrane protein